MKPTQTALSDPVLGQLHWSIPCKAWEGEFRTTAGDECLLYIKPSDSSDQPITEEARRAFVAIARDIEQIHRYSISRLLQDGYDWGGRPEPSIEELTQQLTPYVMSVSPDGSAHVSFCDPTDCTLGPQILTCRFWPDGEREVLIES